MSGYKSNTLRHIQCRNCGETNDAYFPFGYRGIGIECCPACGGRDIEIVLP